MARAVFDLEAAAKLLERNTTWNAVKRIWEN
jgi:hypothetical protein